MRVVTDASSIFKMVTRDKESRERIRQIKTTPADVIQLSGCKNYETSTDIFGPVLKPSARLSFSMDPLAQ